MLLLPSSNIVCEYVTWVVFDDFYKYYFQYIHNGMSSIKKKRVKLFGSKGR